MASLTPDGQDPPGLRRWTGKERIADLRDTVVLGDCLEVMRNLPDACVDLIHTSPPYNIDRPYAAFGDTREPAVYFEFLGAVVAEMKRVLRPWGSLFWQTGYTQENGTGSGGIHPLDIESHGPFRADPALVLWDRIIWRYLGGMAFKRKFTNRHETLLWWVKPGPGRGGPTFNLDEVRERSREHDVRNHIWGRNPGNVWEVDRVAYGSAVQTTHIAVFPEEISSRVVLAASQPGNLVFDPFAGSGTTPKVAKLFGRHWLGTEVAEEYAVEAAVRVGMQAPGLGLSLGSALVRARAFGDKRVAVPPHLAHVECSAWVDAAEWDEATALVDKAAQLAEARAPAKRDVWTSAERGLADPAASSMPGFWRAADLLSHDFRLMKAFHPIQQLRYVLQAATELKEIVSARDPASFVALLAAGEPCTFQRYGDALLLACPERTVRSYGQRRGTAATSKLL